MQTRVLRGLAALVVAGLTGNAALAGVDTLTSVHPARTSSSAYSVYVVSNAANDMSAIDPLRRTVVRTLPSGPNPVDLAVTPDGQTAYITNSNVGNLSLNSVTPVDLVSGAAGRPITGVAFADNIVLSHDGKTAYVAQFGGGVASIDLTTKAVTEIYRACNAG